MKSMSSPPGSFPTLLHEYADTFDYSNDSDVSQVSFKSENNKSDADDDVSEAPLAKKVKAEELDGIMEYEIRR